jgi:hypothetical protein
MFRVDYLASVLNAMALLWLQADPFTRPLITAAADQIDTTLQRDPHNAGESRAGGLRILIVLPLGVLFQIEPDGQTVTVIDIWFIP